jgi:hypothetical protein
VHKDRLRGIAALPLSGVAAHPCAPLVAAVLAILLASTAPALANVSHKGWPQRTGVLLMNKRDQSRPLDARPGFDPFDNADPSYACLGVVGDGDHSCLNMPDTSGSGGSDLGSGDTGSSSGDSGSGSSSGPIITGGGWTCFSAPGVTDLPGAIDAPGLGPDAVCVPTGTPGAPTASSPSSSGSTSASSASGAARVTLASDGHNELLGGHGNDTIHAGPHGDVIWGDYKPSGQPTSQVDHLYGGPGNDFIYASHGRNSIWTGGGRDVVHAHFGHGAIHCQSAQVTVFMTRQTRHRWHLFGPCHVSYAHTLD